MRYRVKYSAQVNSSFDSGSFEIAYFDGLTSDTINPRGSDWESTFVVENPSTTYVEIEASADPDSLQPPLDSPPGVLVPQVPPRPYLVCGIEVDGVERVHDEGNGRVSCRVDLTELAGSEAPADSAAAQSRISGAVWLLLVLSVVAGGVLVSLRNARPQVASAGQTAPSEDPLPGTGGGMREPQDENTQADHELRPHVQLMVVSGAVGLLMLITGLVLSLALDPALSVPTLPSLPNLPDLPDLPTLPGGGR